jgi:8-oxo-dGTP pyrophosphatase MutT (NUDIX family)
LSFRETLKHLETALKGDLPGAAAHALMAPRPRRNWPPGFSIERIRHAAGLLLLFPVNDQPHVVLTVRAQTLDRHGGQVSLPGGVIEAGETWDEAAFREAQEEIGLPTGDAERLGVLSPIDIPVSGFRLHPVVASTARKPALQAAEGEVARIVEPPLAHLMDPARIEWRTMARETGPLEFPVFLAEGVEIWGATAMVLAELLTILGWAGPAPHRS